MPLVKRSPTDTIVEVTIDSLAGLGDGVVHYNGNPLFVPKSCVGDRLKVRITQEAKDACHGVITEILYAGPTRREAPCAHFHHCGGCSLQQLDPETYQHFKLTMLQQSLHRAGLSCDTSPILFLPAATRRRVEFKLHHHDGKTALAFHQPRSHRLIAVHECPILEPALAALIAPLNHALSQLSCSRLVSAISLTAADSGIDMVLTVSGDIASCASELSAMCNRLNIARLSQRQSSHKLEVLVTAKPVYMRLADIDVPLPPDAFLQASAEGQSALTQAAVAATSGASSIIDLFCGIGTYSFPLSQQAQVHAIEGDSAMVGTIRNTISRQALASLTVEQRDLFDNPIPVKQIDSYDAAIINPPRAGAKAQCEKLAHSTIPTIVMISCNPATFSRDARILCDGGYHLHALSGVDQFVWSEHLELVAIFRR